MVNGIVERGKKTIDEKPAKLLNFEVTFSLFNCLINFNHKHILYVCDAFFCQGTLDAHLIIYYNQSID